MIEKIKKHWKILLIILLSILFVSNCTSKGNYKRKYNAQIEHTRYVVDSLDNVYHHVSYRIDSLQDVIDVKDLQIESLTRELGIYKDQNNKLANKPVVVRIEEKKSDK